MREKSIGRAFGARLLGYGKEKELSKYEGFRVLIADVKETENSVIASLEIPGVEKKDIDLNITENSIEVKIEKKAEKEFKEDLKF